MIQLGYIHNGMVNNCFTESIVRLMYYDKPTNGGRGILAGVNHKPGLFLAENRNALIDRFMIDHPCDWMLMIDTDIAFLPEDVYSLIDKNEMFCTGVYFSQWMNDDRIYPIWIEQRGGNEYAGVTSLRKNSLYTLTGAGCGFMLVHRSVFEKIALAYPDDPWKWFNHDLEMTVNGPSRLGEDFTFCKRARTAGYSLIGHSGIHVRHEKRVILDMSMFEAQQLYLSMKAVA